jgi:hypothetical protein
MARRACEQALLQLAAAAEASANVFERDSLLIGHFELNRQQALFISAFQDALQERVRRDWQGNALAGGGNASTDWQSLSLVDDREVEAQVAADRLAMQLAQAADAQWQQWQAFTHALQRPDAAGGAKPALRAETIAHAAQRALLGLSTRDDVQRVLETTFYRCLGAALPDALNDIMAQWRAAGVREQTQPLRSVPGGKPAATGAGAPTPGRAGGAGHAGGAEFQPSGASVLDEGSGFARSASGRFAHSGHGGLDPQTQPGGLGPGRGAAGGSGGGWGGYQGRPASQPSLGQVGSGMMGVLRRLSNTPVQESGAVSSGFGSLSHSTAAGGLAHSGSGSGFGPLAMPNLIHAHREELREAAAGQLDVMVIDVVATLFDAILSDPKVPPQMARLIGRLQLPVLRAALGDPSFFSMRRHPVRRLVNRIASLGSAFDDFAGEEAQRFLARVKELVQAIVEGDFERLDLYEVQLAELESFVQEQAQREAKESGDAARLLAEREAGARIQQRYALTLQGALRTLNAPDFVRDFVSEVWSGVLVQASLAQPADAARVQRLREAARDLFLSVQPKAGTAQRKTFLTQLPPLMKALNEGLDLIAWPAAARSAFFGALLPAHARSLKGEVKEDGRVEGISALDYNLMARQLESLLATPLPQLNQLPAATPEAAPEPRLDETTAKAVGLLEESAVDWTAPVPQAPQAEPTPAVADLQIAGLPTVEEPTEPVQGRGLADHVQIGFAYQMLLENQWQKVRVNHISPGRTFFVFTRGKRHKQAISLTHRMLVKLCETERFRAYESAALLERATARARSQLAKIGIEAKRT